MAMKPEFQQEANWDPALTALPILEAPGFRVDSWRFESATFPFYAFDPGAMRVLEILRESGVIRCAFYLFIRQPHGSEVSPAVPWCTTRDLGPQLSCIRGFEVPYEHFQTHSAEVCEEGSGARFSTP